MSDQPVRVLALAACYNRKEKTLRSVRGLIEGNPGVRFSFLITDDNSNDGTCEALEAIPEANVLHGSGGLYYSGGMRLAIGQALATKEIYDFCLLFNDDVDFYPHAIECLASQAKNSIWVGPVCDEGGQLSYGGVRKLSHFRPAFQTIKSENPEGAACDTFHANCVLIPWGIFRQLGNLDPVYTHAMSDFDYGFHARRLGYEIRVSDRFAGCCSDNPPEGTWRDPALPRRKRLELKESPKGLPRREWFHYLRKNYSLATAVVYSGIAYGRILCGR